VYQTHQKNFSGTCLITQGPEILFSEAGGLANRDFDVPNTMETRFDTASVTKLFTAAAVMQLVEQGKFKLSTRIHEILDLKGTMIPRTVCVEHLLNHTSGIADDADEEAGEVYAALFLDKPNYAVRENADLLPGFVHKKPNFTPGTNVRYNNCAFVLLGLAIEKVTGKPYREAVAERVFQPAGMAATYFGAKDEVCPGTAEGYFAQRDGDGNFVKWKKNIYSFPPVGTAESGAYTTVGDLDNFIRAVRGGKLVSRENAEVFLRPHCVFTRQRRFGTWRTGYALEFLEVNGRVFCMYKEGGNPGVDAFCSYYPELDIGVYILANQDGPLWRMVEDFQGVLYQMFVGRVPKG